MFNNFIESFLYITSNLIIIIHVGSGGKKSWLLLAMSTAAEFRVGWLVVLRIYVALAVFQPYRDLEAGDNQSLKIQVLRPGIKPQTSCFASQELNHLATAAPQNSGITCHWLFQVGAGGKKSRLLLAMSTAAEFSAIYEYFRWEQEARRAAYS